MNIPRKVDAVLMASGAQQLCVHHHMKLKTIIWHCSCCSTAVLAYMQQERPLLLACTIGTHVHGLTKSKRHLALATVVCAVVAYSCSSLYVMPARTPLCAMLHCSNPLQRCLQPCCLQLRLSYAVGLMHQ
jgi:hypothetical protein